MAFTSTFPTSTPLSLLLFSLLTLLFLGAHSDPQPSLLLLPSEDNICPPPSPTDPTHCPIKCFRPDPVCGEDGVTYWCGCPDARCHGVKVSKLGFCHVGNAAGSGPLSGQALLLVHIVWLIVLGFSVLCGLL